MKRKRFPRAKLAEFFRMDISSPKNITPGGKELMLRLAEEKRERRRKRNGPNEI